MKVLITGGKGQLGFAVRQRLDEQHIPCIAVDKEEFDLAKQAETVAYIKSCMPDAVVHCAAYTAVDKAESEKALCYDINVNGTKNIVLACKETGAKLIYISTDYIFDGAGNAPHETEEKPNPVNYYGETKYQGELAVKQWEKSFVIRTSWVFGENGNNFINTMLRLAREGKKLRVVDDQTGAPTYTVDLARLIGDMLKTESYGTYHATNEGACTWYELANYIFECKGLKPDIVAVTSAEYVTAARRPQNSRLSKSSLDAAGFTRLPHWRDAVQRYLNNIK